ncbi:arginine--tRNA ligase [Nisaea acidiphila]|uniref:Arginine--tRNA ligase n=1 Tax=Nisaea acidiphila TaxID=1862145 RepID=A0A9J7AUC8_9PROT|nr:arginine--tRNA ligase [Nisaea acidiphila]UUX50089.1 arginine--tRNA ligase [Nisaea acidiphila]
MNVFNHFQTKLNEELESLSAGGALPADLDVSRAGVEPPRDPSHGDIATNAAMVLAKQARMKPRDIADLLAERMRGWQEVSEAEIAGPGFINLRIADTFWRGAVADLLKAGIAYGKSDMGAGKKVMVEYVSANPTGPLHAAHARGAIVGDALAALLDKAGFDVLREYYINDAGTQVDTVARSTFLRYREALGEEIGAIPEGLYPGEYLKEVGEALAKRDGDKWLGKDEAEWLPEIRSFAIAEIMGWIKEDLGLLGVDMAVYSSEKALVEAGAVDKVMETLEGRDLLYTGVLEPPKGKKSDDWEPRPQRLFKATEFGDDVDRPIQKSDGSWTYFANDIAYHLDKYRRGYAEMIDVWGADHGGYVKRMKAAVKAVTGGEGELDVKLCQLVHLMDGGKPVKMSKRAGTFVTMRDVIDSVGKDVLRFIMLTRRNDQTLEFDFKKVTEQSRENPVFYVQYAHARCHSVLRHAEEALSGAELSGTALASVVLDRLTDPAELGLMKLLLAWPRTVEGAAEAHEPHRIAFYLGDVAAAFHGLWNKGKDDTTLRFLVDGDSELTMARLALVRATQTVIASGLDVIGVEPVEELRA